MQETTGGKDCYLNWQAMSMGEKVEIVNKYSIFKGQKYISIHKTIGFVNKLFHRDF